MNPLISAAELVAQEGHVIVVDVRHDLNDPTAGLLGYASGHLPQAVFLSVDEDLSGEATALNGGRHPFRAQRTLLPGLTRSGARMRPCSLPTMTRVEPLLRGSGGSAAGGRPS